MRAELHDAVHSFLRKISCRLAACPYFCRKTIGKARLAGWASITLTP